MENKMSREYIMGKLPLPILSKEHEEIIDMFYTDKKQKNELLEYLCFAIKRNIAEKVIQNVEYHKIDRFLEETNSIGLKLFHGYSDEEVIRIILTAFPVTKEMYGTGNVCTIGYAVEHKNGKRNFMARAI